MRPKSRQLFQQAIQHIPGGVNSPVRAYKAVGGQPVFIARGEGAWLWDVDGNRYIDYVASYGPMILGHGEPSVTQAVQQAVARGLSYGAPTEAEVLLADKICTLLPAIDKVRMVNSGTEATMSAIRLARGFSGKNKVVKFEGCYHGHADGLLVKAGSGALTLGVPTSPGVPPSVTEHTLCLEFNNLQAVQDCFDQYGSDIAAIIVEPIAGNMNCVPPVSGFLEGLRHLCDSSGAILIFDEVMTGFRAGPQGAQGVYGVKPDLTTLGKVIGGGMPVGAFGGRADIMDHIAPDGPVYQAGTLSGNPVAMAAGLATLNIVSEPGFFERLEEKVLTLRHGLEQAASKHGINLHSQSVGSMFGVFFTAGKPISYLQQVEACDIAAFSRFFNAMLDRGIFLAPSAFETAFMSAAHSDDDIQRTLDAASESFALV